jgi:hypothetical protein
VNDAVATCIVAEAVGTAELWIVRAISDGFRPNDIRRGLLSEMDVDMGVLGLLKLFGVDGVPGVRGDLGLLVGEPGTRFRRGTGEARARAGETLGGITPASRRTEAMLGRGVIRAE